MSKKFLDDLRAAREQYASNTDELNKVMNVMRRRLDDPNVLSGEVLQRYMCSLRDIQDYDAILQLVNDLQSISSLHKHINTDYIKFMYAFALNRRNQEGDRDKALQMCKKATEKSKNQYLDMLCAGGRIEKDKFVESDHQHKESLQNAVDWYRRSFEVQPNEYAGINLATLLVVDGKDFSNDQELQHIGIVLNNLIGKKGSLFSLEDYWDVATFFEISVLAGNYAKANQAAECMFKLKPLNWYLKSTIGNLTLIDRYRKKHNDVCSNQDQQIFQFWIEFFIEAASVKSISPIRFPILIVEPSQQVYMPSFVTVNMGAEEQSIQIINICLAHEEKACRKIHDFVFTASQIKSIR
jgi:mitogen-activated protein kinase kinase kinase 5